MSTIWKNGKYQPLVKYVTLKDLKKLSTAIDIINGDSDTKGSIKNTIKDLVGEDKLNDLVDKTTMDTELAKKFDKASVVQDSGDSEELVMSQKAVSDKLSELKVADAFGDGHDAELSLIDDNGYAIAQFRDGHIKTKNFDSRYINSELGNLPYIGEKICVKLNKFSKELLFKESKSDINSQGCAVFDKYLFQFYNSNNVIDIFDLVEKTLIQTIALEPVSTYHCNNANFGNEYYAQNDLFPLLYVSQENELEHKCLVYRVTNGPGEFVLTLVQTITFPSPSYNFMWYPNCMIDVQNNKIIIAGLGNKPWSVGIDNIVRYKLFTLPKLSEGDVTIDEENCEDTIEVKFLPTTQGGFVLNNKIIQVFGMGNNAQLNVIDITTHRLVSKVDLSKNVLSREPEGCFLYEDAICVVFSDGQIFKLIF